MLWLMDRIARWSTRERQPAYFTNSNGEIKILFINFDSTSQRSNDILSYSLNLEMIVSKFWASSLSFSAR